MSAIPLQEFQAVQNACEAFRTEVERLRARIEFLEGTLQPFSDAAVDAEGYPDDHPLGCDPQMELSVEIDEGAFGPLKVIHLRRARLALTTGHETGGRNG